MSEPITRPPFDAHVARALDEMSHLIVISMGPEDIDTVRANGEPIAEAELTLHGAFVREEHFVEVDAGEPAVRVVTYVPRDAFGVRPVIVHLHGGGLIAGTADSDLPAMTELAALTGCAVASVDYRLAPEHPYPAALADAAAALAWVAGPESPAAFDSSRIVLSGVSAGGGLAASTALHARDKGGPALAGLLLMCPMLDHRSDSPSALQMEGVGSWDRHANLTAWGAYLGADPATADAAAADPSGHASAARAASVSGLPPTFIDVGSAETFRDECVAFADRIWLAGGDAELHVWPGGVHAFDYLAPWAPMAKDARATRLAWLRRLLVRL